MSEEMTQTTHSENPAWFDGKKINEAMFCEEFLRDYLMITVNGAFFTVNGRVHDENRLKKAIYDLINTIRHVFYHEWIYSRLPIVPKTQ